MRYLIPFFLFLSACPSFEGKDEATQDGQPVVVAPPVDTGCDPNAYDASACSRACFFKAGACAIWGFGSRCWIYNCNVDSECSYTCAGSCGYIDQLHPEGCNPLPPQ